MTPNDRLVWRERHVQIRIRYDISYFGKVDRSQFLFTGDGGSQTLAAQYAEIRSRKRDVSARLAGELAKNVAPHFYYKVLIVR